MKTTEPTNQKPHTVTEALAERIRQAAARHCPEEYRPAFCLLLKNLWIELDTLREDNELSEAEETELIIRYHILQLLTNYPRIDIYDFAEMAYDLSSNFPGLQHFGERIYCLADLQQPD